MDPMEKANKVLAALEAAAKAKKSEEGDKVKGEKEAAHKEAMGKAADLCTKAYKAVGAMHEHISGMDEEHMGEGLKEDSAKVHKAMKALHGEVHKAAGIEPDKEDEKEDGAKAVMADAMKSIGALQAKIEMLEKGIYQPRAVGAGAGVVTAAKGMGAGEVATKAVKDMTEDELNAARKAALDRSRMMPIPADRFSSTSMEALRAADKILQAASSVDETVA